MKKFKVKIKYEREIKAENKEDALTVFWENWENECIRNNTTEIIELNDTAIVKEIKSKEQ